MQQLIMLVEDNPADARLTVDAFRRQDPQLAFELFEDGESALVRLEDATRALPDLILLDLNLPGIDGREVLARVKADSRLCRIPVCVLTTSRAEQDIHTAYGNHSNCYVVKPVDLHQFRAVVEQIERFWFTTAEMPPRRTTPTP